MNKHNTKHYEGGAIPMDESWWSAVLAEEEELGGAGVKQSYVLSDSKASHSISKSTTVDWDRAEEIYEHDEAISLLVTGYNRGGLLVEGEGLQGFVPVSHLVDLSGEKPESEEDASLISAQLSAYVSKSLRLKIIECEPDRGRVVFSERAALAEPGRRNQLLDELLPGQCVSGTVTNVTDFGVFVDLGGVEGLIHVSELSWGRVRHPSDVAAVGNRVEAYVIKVEKDRSRVALSLKRLHANPWDTAEQRYRPGQVVEAVVTSVVPFGAFARLEEGLDGLIHISEMSMNGEKVNPHDLVKEGEKVIVSIIHVEAQKQRLGLSLKLNN